MIRKQNDVTITVETTTGTVTVAAEASEDAALEARRADRAYDDVGPHAKSVRENLKQQVRKDIEKKAGEKTASLQTKVTDRLEGELSDVRQELDQAINRVTAEALERKAAQMGQIKEMTEDPQAGSLTIVVEVYVGPRMQYEGAAHSKNKSNSRNEGDRIARERDDHGMNPFRSTALCRRRDSHDPQLPPRLHAFRVISGGHRHCGADRAVAASGAKGAAGVCREETGLRIAIWSRPADGPR